MVTESEQAGLMSSPTNWCQDAGPPPGILGGETLPAGALESHPVWADGGDPSSQTEAFVALAGVPAAAPPIFAALTAPACPGHVGNYKLVEKIHESRMSTVWRAVDEAHRKPVAVKLVPLALAPNFDLDTLARLVRVSVHPGLVTLLDHGREGWWWYQVAEWIVGETLESWSGKATARSPDPSTEFPALMREVALALTAYHSAGFVHGDIKPSNVLIVDGHPRILDLAGLSVGAHWNRRVGLTLAFASPESRAGAPADPRDDVYSLAAMIVQIMSRKKFDPARALDSTTGPPGGIRPSQWNALRAALSPMRERRPASPIALVREVWREWAELEGPTQTVVTHAISPPPVFRDLPSTSPRRAGAKWLAATAAAAAAAAGVLLVTDPERFDIRLPSFAFPASEAADLVIPPMPDQAFPIRQARLVGARNSSDLRTADLRESPSAPVSLDGGRVEQVPSAPMTQSDQVVTAAAMSATSIPTGNESSEKQAGRTRPELAAMRTVALLPDLPRQAETPTVPERPDKPVTPDKPDRPDVVVPQRPEVPVVPERPDKPERPEVVAVPERPDIPVVPQRPDIPVVPERPDKPERPEVAVVPERPDIPAVPQRPDIPVVPERPDKPEKPDRPDKPDKPDRPEKPEKPEKPGRV